jgi:drug/metabolite transporter (DMT)-like permease
VSPRDLKAEALLVLATLLATSGWLFSMMALRGLPPLLFIGVRFVLAGCIVGAFDVGQVRALAIRGVASAILSGLVMSVAMICWIKGLDHTDNIGVGAFICSLGNIGAPLLGRVLFRSKLSGGIIASIAVATIGAAFLMLDGGFHVAGGDLFFLASALSSSLQFNLNSRFSTRLPALALTSVQLMVVGGVSLMSSLATEAWPRSIDFGTIGWLTASVLIATSFRFFIQFKAQGMTTVGRAAIIMNLEPVWTAFVAAMWLGMGMRATQAFGSALVFLALLLNRWNDISPLVVRWTPRLVEMIGARLRETGGLTIGGCAAPAAETAGAEWSQIPMTNDEGSSTRDWT